jgi:ubiquitin-like-conjugating enzyme ATG3
MSLRHTIHGLYKGVAEAVLPPRSATGGFRETGVLTPDEFVAAGDFLVATCPSWAWQARLRRARRTSWLRDPKPKLCPAVAQGGERSKLKAYLPPDKQFLITRNVPCFKRAAAVEGALGAAEAMVEGTCPFRRAHPRLSR